MDNLFKVSRNDLLRGRLDTFTEKYFGVYKVSCTGNVVSNDSGFIEVLFQGITIPARPVYELGSRVMIPTTNWLKKYRDEVYFLVTFEEGNINRCVFLGWSFKDSASDKAIKSLRNAANFRSIYFKETFDDTTKTFRLSLEEEQYTEITSEGWFTKFKKAVFNIPEFLIKSDKYTVESSDVKLGSDAAKSEAVKGDELNKTLTELIQAQSQSMVRLSTSLSALSIAASANPATAGLAAQLNTCATETQNIGSTLSKIIPKLGSHLSKKVKIE